MEFKDSLKSYFYSHAPNRIIIEHIANDFPNESKGTIQQILLELVQEEFLIKEECQNTLCAVKRVEYKIAPKYITDYPIETELKIGKLIMPRIIDGDRTRGEDINKLLLNFQKIADENNHQLKLLLDKETKKYWRTLITLFGILLALFSIVNISIKPLFFSSELNLSPTDIAFQSLINIAPLTVILFLFLLFLKNIFKD